MAGTVSLPGLEVNGRAAAAVLSLPRSLPPSLPLVLPLSLWLSLPLPTLPSLPAAHVQSPHV